jgi:hypothetical protein
MGFLEEEQTFPVESSHAERVALNDVAGLGLSTGNTLSRRGIFI